MKLYKLRINEQQKVNAGELGAVLLLLTMILYANRHVSNFDEYFVMLKLSTAIGLSYAEETVQLNLVN